MRGNRGRGEGFLELLETGRGGGRRGENKRALRAGFFFVIVQFDHLSILVVF